MLDSLPKVQYTGTARRGEVIAKLSRWHVLESIEPGTGKYTAQLRTERDKLFLEITDLMIEGYTFRDLQHDEMAREAQQANAERL